MADAKQPLTGRELVDQLRRAAQRSAEIAQAAREAAAKLQGTGQPAAPVAPGSVAPGAAQPAPRP